MNNQQKAALEIVESIQEMVQSIKHNTSVVDELDVIDNEIDKLRTFITTPAANTGDGLRPPPCGQNESIGDWNKRIDATRSPNALQRPEPSEGDNTVDEVIRHQISYAEELGIDDDGYVETCPLQLKTWKAIKAALAPRQVDVEALKTAVFAFEIEYEAIHGRLPSGWAIINHLHQRHLLAAAQKGGE